MVQIVVWSLGAIFHLHCMPWKSAVRLLGDSLCLQRFGSGIVYAMNPIVISEHFDKYRALATGINYAGSPLGSFVFPKLLEYLVGAYGFRSAMLIFGGILLNCLVFSLFLRQTSRLRTKNRGSEVERREEPKSQDEPYIISSHMPEPGGRSEQKHEPVHGPLAVFRLPIFYVVTYSYISFSLSYDCYNSLLIDFAIDQGVDMSDAVTMTSICSLADLLGRLILPALIDRGLVNGKVLMMAVFALVGALYTILPYVSGFGAIFTFTMGMAVLLGCSVVLFPVLLVEYVGLDDIFMATGMLTALSAVFSFVKPSIIGYFRDTLGAYDFLFVACGCGAIVASLMWVAIAAEKRTTERHTWTLEPQNTERDISDGTYKHVPRPIHMGDENHMNQKQASAYMAAFAF